MADGASDRVAQSVLHIVFAEYDAAVDLLTTEIQERGASASLLLNRAHALLCEAGAPASGCLHVSGPAMRAGGGAGPWLQSRLGECPHTTCRSE